MTRIASSATEPSRSTPSPAPSLVPPEATKPPIDLELAEAIYRHPEGLFELRPPKGWKPAEGPDSTRFESATGELLIEIQATGTGYELDATSFREFVNGREGTLYPSGLVTESIHSNIDDAARNAVMVKTIESDGDLHAVRSIYLQCGAWVFTLDFELPAEDYVGYEPAMRTVEKTFRPICDELRSDEPYQWIYTFEAPEGLFRLDVPVAWTHDTKRADFVTIDTFTSPDGRALLESIVYDDRSELTRSDAGVLALALLRKHYAQDLVVLGDSIQPDGSERLTWLSADGRRGASFLETRGTTFLMLTLLYDESFDDVYFDLLSYLAATYHAP